MATEDSDTPGADANTGQQPSDEERLAELRAELLELLEETPSEAREADSDDLPSVSIDQKGFRVTSADGESSIKIGGRIQADANWHERRGSLDPLINDGTELRRARFELKGTLPESLFWAAEVDFAGNRTSMKDFWAGYATDLGPEVTFGHQKQPYSLDVEMSSNDIPFVERGVDTFLIIPFVDRAIGLRVQDNTDSLFYAAGLFGEGIDPDGVDDEGWGAAGRVTYAPVQTDSEVLHLGVRLAFRQPEDGMDGIRIKDETTNMSNFAIVDTGDILGVDSVQLYGTEAVWAAGPFSIGGEYNVMTVEQSGPDYEFDSWHVQATYSLTGESRARAYRVDSGEFKRLSAGDAGGRPWEIAARVASIDLNDGSLSGGAEDAFSLGLTWYYSPNMRLMWNWTNVFDTSGGSAATAEAEDLDIFTFRTQLTF